MLFGRRLVQRDPASQALEVLDMVSEMRMDVMMHDVMFEKFNHTQVKHTRP